MDNSQIVSREKAIQSLRESFNTEEFLFTAKFSIPKNIKLIEGSRPFGYFQNFEANGKLIYYPQLQGFEYNTRISIKYPIKDDLIDEEIYVIKGSLAEDRFRTDNPYRLSVKSYKKLENEYHIDLDIKETIGQIYKEKLNQNSPYTMVELANSVESLATDIYSENKRFIYELIQNADDAAFNNNSALEIRITSNYVVISHQGKPFDARDLRGLCSIGIGTKRNDSTKTGYKGIGFKSVFGQPQGIVYVKSEDVLFRFDREFVKNKGWNPNWGNKEKWERENNISFSCPWQMIPIYSTSTNDPVTDKILNDTNYSVKTAIKIGNSASLYRDISALFKDARFLLFLRRINKVSLITDANSLVLKKITHENSNVVSLQKNDTVLSNWFVKNWIHDIPLDIQEDLKKDSKTPKKIQDMEKTELSFAFQLNDDASEIKLLKNTESPLYSYLPTIVTEYNFPFLVNCNFLIDAGREKIHKDRIWNIWLFKVIGFKTVECCSIFAKSKLFTESYLSILKNGFFEAYDTLRNNYNQGLKIGIDKEPFIFNRNSDLCKIKDVCLDHFNLIDNEIATANSVTNFLNTIQSVEVYKPENIITVDKQINILKKFDVAEFSTKQLKEFCESSFFIEQIFLNTNYKILEFLMDLDEKDSSKEWYSIITNNSYIINEDNVIDKITTVCFPVNVPYEDPEFRNKLIHPELYNQIQNNEALKNWLIKLGVTEPSSIAYLEKEIIAKIDSCITDVTYLDITEFLIGLHLNKRLEEHHYVELQKLPLQTNFGFKKANECVLPEIYHPVLDFSSIFNDLNIVTEKYIRNYNAFDLRYFFKRLNVTDDIEFLNNYTRTAKTLPPNYVNISNGFAKEGHYYPHLVGIFYPNYPSYEVTYYLQYFSFFDRLSNSTFSLLFWNRVMRKYHLTFDKKQKTIISYAPERDVATYNLSEDLSLLTLDKMNWGRISSNKVLIPSYIFWVIENDACIPTKNGNKLAKEVFINSSKIIELVGDYLPTIAVETEVSHGWNQVLKLKSKLDIHDLLCLLGSIAIDTHKDGRIKKENEKRIGLIYNELIEFLKSNHETTEKEIKLWSSKNKLVATNHKSYSPNDIVLIKNIGFTDIESSINTLLVPKNVDVNSEYFENLLIVLGIKIIDDFDYSADNKIESLDFKIKILGLVPYLGLLLKSRLKISNYDEYFYDILTILEEFKFIKCDNLKLVFLYKSEEIKGAPIDYHYDKNELLITKQWSNPTLLYSISIPLSKLLRARYLDKEILFLISLSDVHLKEYFASLGLTLDEISKLECYKKIQEKIQEIKDSQKPIPTTNQEIKPIDTEIKPPTIFDTVEESVATEIKAEIKPEIETDTNNISFTTIEINELEALLNRSLSPDEISDIWLIAAFRALKYYENEGYDVSYAKSDFDNVISKRYLENVISPERIVKNILVRSAKHQLLRLSYNAWTDLALDDFELFVVTGNDSEDFYIYTNQNEIAAMNEDSWLIRIDGDNKVKNIDSILNGPISDIKYESIELLIRLPGNTNYNSIFSKFNDNKTSLDDF